MRIRVLGSLWCVLVSWITSPVGFAETANNDVNSARDVEEVTVHAVAQCGSWPIAHIDIVGCEYAELKPEMLNGIRKNRAAYLTRCMRCENGTCVPRTWSRDQLTTRNLCKRLFVTPIKVSSRSGGSSVSDASLFVRFSYAISRRGRVEDIHMDLLDSDLTDSQVYKLIENGARQVRFEPLKVEGQTVSIVGLQDGYMLTGTF